MRKDLIVRIIIIFLVTVGAVFWGLTFILNNGIKSRATGETMTYSFLMFRATADQEYHALIEVKPSLTIMTRGYSFVTAFDKDKLELKKIEYKLGSVSQGLGQTDANLAAINNQGKVELVGEIVASAGSPMTADTNVGLVDLTFKYTGTGVATGSINKNTAVVYWYKTDGTLVEVPAVATATFGIDGGVVPTATPTGVVGGVNVKLKIKLKIQGIASKPADALNSLNIKFRIYDENTEKYTDNDGSKFTANDAGIWSGDVDFNNIVPSHKYVLYVKGPFQVQKKVCDKIPKETDGGTYKCTRGVVALKAGVNDLDLTGIILLSGDLPTQDGTINAYDTSLIRNNVGKDEDKCDVNRDGKCDTQDYSLLISTLSIKNDEQ